jgi:polyphosphate kinase 2 (PPK2 family)
VHEFLELSKPEVEKAMVDSGILLLKYWLEVSPEEQERRLKGSDHGSPEDLEAVPFGSGLVHALG